MSVSIHASCTETTKYYDRRSGELKVDIKLIPCLLACLKLCFYSRTESAAVSDFAMSRDRSGTWHTSQLTTNRSMSMNEEKIRKASMPGRNDKPFASRPTQLTVVSVPL